MSTQRLLPKMRKGMGRSVVSPLSLLAGVLLVWQLALPSVALAFQTAAKPTPTPTANITSTVVPPSTVATAVVTRPTPLAVAQDAAQALAQVSVVRLVATYTSTATPTLGHALVSATCTGLGVLVGSWSMTPGSTALTNWVLTDSTALGSKDCPTTNNTKVTSIQVLANDVYSNTEAASTSPAAAPLASVLCATTSSACQVLQLSGVLPPVPCIPPQCAGPVVFAFASTPSTRPQPFVGLGMTGSVAHIGIQLVNSGGQQPSASTSSAEHYLLVTRFPATDGALTPSALAPAEVGMPLFNQEGQVVGMRLSSGTLDLDGLNNFLTAQGPAPHANALNTAWMQGITAFYGPNGQPKDFSKAIAQFQTAQSANSAFQAATFMKNAAIKALPSTPKRPTSSSGLFGVPYWVLAIFALFILIALLLLVSLMFGWRRAQRLQKLTHFKADQAEVQMGVQGQQQGVQLGNNANQSAIQRLYQNARITLSARFGRKNTLPPDQPLNRSALPGLPPRTSEIPRSNESLVPSVFQQQHSFSIPQPSLIVNELKTTPINPLPAPGPHCPNCGQAVPTTATYCPNCRYQLAPLAQSSRSPLSTGPVMEMSMSNQVPKPSIVFQPSQESVTEPIQDDRIVRETLRRLWDREGR